MLHVRKEKSHFARDCCLGERTKRKQCTRWRDGSAKSCSSSRAQSTMLPCFRNRFWMVNVCPKWSDGSRPRGPTGKLLQGYRERQLGLKIGAGTNQYEFQVADVTKPTLSVCCLCGSGTKAHLRTQRTLQMKDAVNRWSRGTVSTTSRLKMSRGRHIQLHSQ